ncbi:MAG TPA: SH3 domain-containing protein [Anaerolineales bacterium]|nr:SH3 domain-containing protein [Anaerolineales bacterium]
MKSLKKLITFLFDSLLLITLTACQIGTAAPAYLTVQEATNCRTGPGESYEIVFTYLSGTKLEIVSRYDPGNFWLVKSAESPTGTCWMWGEYVEVTGNASAVPNVTPPSASTTEPVETFIVDRWEYSCGSEFGDFTLNWQDRATNETGYRIFRNGELLIELPADSTFYTDTFALTEDQRSMEYYLQVFGSDWTMNSTVMSADC